MIYNIQGLRFLASFSIVIAHVILFGNDKYGLGLSGLDGLTDYLMIGVDMFFVISGFIMVYVKQLERPTDKKPHYLKIAGRFLYKRATRIYPVYWLLCAALLPIFFMYPHWINSGAENPTSLLHSFLLLPDAGIPLIMVAWTLEFEMFFYLVFALTLWFGTLTQLFMITVLLGGFVVAGIIWPDIQHVNAYVHLMTSSLLCYFIAGMWLAYFYSCIKNVRVYLVLSLPALIGALVWMFQYRLGEIDRFIHFGPVAVLSVAVLLLCEKAGWTAFKLFQKWGGNISYSLYLVHVLVISAWGRILSAFLDNGLVLSTLFVTGSVAGSIIAATILYYGFEKPSLRVLRKIVRKADDGR